MAERQGDVHANKSQHQPAEHLALWNTETFQPPPSPSVKGQTVQKFHRDNDPRNTEQMHGIAPNPALAKPKTDHGHGQQTQTTQHGRKNRSDQGADGRPNHHHGHGQALANRLLTVDRHLRG